MDSLQLTMCVIEAVVDAVTCALDGFPPEQRDSIYWSPYASAYWLDRLSRECSAMADAYDRQRAERGTPRLIGYDVLRQCVVN